MDLLQNLWMNRSWHKASSVKICKTHDCTFLIETVKIPLILTKFCQNELYTLCFKPTVYICWWCPSQGRKTASFSLVLINTRRSKSFAVNFAISGDLVLDFFFFHFYFFYQSIINIFIATLFGLQTNFWCWNKFFFECFSHLRPKNFNACANLISCQNSFKLSKHHACYSQLGW